VLNLDGLSNVEQIILLAFALLVAYVVFKTLAGLLRIVLVVAVLAGVWTSDLLHDDTGGQVTNLSPEAQYAVAEFNRCLKEAIAGAVNPESECKQRVIDFVQQSHGAEYSKEVSRAIEALLKISHQTTLQRPS
jgi:hypothetical protein